MPQLGSVGQNREKSSSNEHEHGKVVGKPILIKCLPTRINMQVSEPPHGTLGGIAGS